MQFSIMLRDIRKQWQIRKEKDINLERSPDQDLINYAILPDYKTIIMHNWEALRRYFKDKQMLRVRLDDLNNYCRNVIMHARNINPYETSVAIFNILWLRKRMIRAGSKILWLYPCILRCGVT